MDADRMKRDFSVGWAWLRENGMDYAGDHPEAVLIVLFVLFLLMSCGS